MQIPQLMLDAGSTADTIFFFWLERFRIKASSKSILNQQFMNVDENGSVANAFVQNMAFDLSGKVKMTIRDAGQSLKSTNLTSHIT